MVIIKMINTINTYSNQIYTPPYYHRQYEHDLPENLKDSSSVETAKRAVHLAIPFLSLYKPLGQLISLSMGTTRIITSGATLFSTNSGSETAYTPST